MSDTSLRILISTAVTVGFVHTLIGLDHTLPFVVLGRARGWSLRKVLVITGLCGLGHVLSSVVLGLAGVGLGAALHELEWIESARGNLAAWSLIGFGLAYAAWSIVRAQRGHRHAHFHVHTDGEAHSHEHDHRTDHLHSHAAAGAGLTVWALFVIFVLGPCEPLIPLMMVPAAELGATATALVVLAFAATTIGTMLALVAVAYCGLRLTALGRLERHAHAFAGLAIASSGLAILWLGL